MESGQGSFGLALATAHQVGVGSWISLPAQDATITVPARTALGPGTLVVPITVHVPADATPGDHAGGVLVSLSTTGRNGSGQEITLDQRTGTRVLMTVSGTLAPQLAVTDVHASYGGTADPVGAGTVHLSYTVHNRATSIWESRSRRQCRASSGRACRPDFLDHLPAPRRVRFGKHPTPWCVAPSSVPRLRHRNGTDNRDREERCARTGHRVHDSLDGPLGARDHRGRPDPGGAVVPASPQEAPPAGLGSRHATTVHVQPGPEGRSVRMRARCWPGSGRAARSVALGCLTVLGAAVALAQPLGAPLMGTAGAATSTVPYTDPDAVGSIGLCNQAGQQITSGSITTRPFAWRAVSTQAAPAPYNNAGRTATLVAYQPQQALPR